MRRDNPRTEFASTLDAAHEYLRRGWSVVPIPCGQKAPVHKGWPSLRLSEVDLHQNFGHGENVGIILGRVSADLTDIDLDCTEAIAVATFLLPSTGLVLGRASKPRSHYFYICDPLPAPQKFSAFDGETLVELRGNGQQTVVPPSIHPCGEVYQFEYDGEPGRVDGKALAQAVRSVASAALLARHWPAQGQRNNAANAAAGMLLRAGWDEDQTARFIEAVALAAGDEEVRQRVRDVISTSQRLASGGAATGEPTLAQIVGDETVRRMREWFQLDLRIDICDAPFSSFSPPWPEPLAPEAFHGLAGKIVRFIEPQTEADPAALLLQFLVAFGNAIGPGTVFSVERHSHHANLFSLIVGVTAKGRKGTSWAHIAAIFKAVDPVWIERRVHGGVGSGEGIISAVRDPVLKGNKVIEEGIEDKRLILLETEFAQILAVMERHGGTTSEVLRRAWDGTLLQTLVKSALRATGAHISAIGHITKDELLRHLGKTEVANGLMNRFLFCCARRSKVLPDGGYLDDSRMKEFVEELAAAVAFSRESRELKRDPEAAALWRDVYPDLSEGRTGLFGAVISRAEAQVLRVSMVFALLDCSPLIRREHLLAGLAVWTYAEDSARYIFGDALGDPIADDIIRALRVRREGLTRSEIHDLFRRHRSEAEISRALSLLMQNGLATWRKEETGGRPVERWFANQRCERSE